MKKEGMELEITELRLGLPGGISSGSVGLNSLDSSKNEKKRVFSDMVSDEANAINGDRNIPTKTQVVGWPPVCSHRRKNGFNDTSKMYVKVSMDGAPFLRKIDLGMHKDYYDLAMALENLFGCFGISEALKDADGNSEYVLIYEDKDGDWMLAGDVPWEMFIESCKRLRIMKGSEAKGFGLQPRGGLKENSRNEQ